MRQVVVCAVAGRFLSYVWHGDEPLRVGDVVRVRNPIASRRERVPLVRAVVAKTDVPQEHPGYLVIIESKVDNENQRI